MRAHVGAAWSLLTLCACRTPAPENQQGEATGGGSPVTAAGASAAPVDHLGPDELIEGPGKAFGITLPRLLEVEGSFVDVVYARGPSSVHLLTRYFRSRLQDGSVREGATASTFEHVKVRGQPGLELFVRIAAAGQGTSVEIRNATPSPAATLPDEQSRWRAVGLTPEGRIANPGHLD